MFRTYVTAEKMRHSIVFNLDKHMIEVENWPATGGTPAEWQWTIFLSRHVRTTVIARRSGSHRYPPQVLDEENQLIKGLHGGRDLEIPGCVLVAKSDQSGHLVDVESEDVYHIKAMLVEYDHSTAWS